MAKSIKIPKKRKRSILYIAFDMFCAIGDLLDDILNPVFRSVATLPKETKEVIGPLIVSIVSILNNCKGLYENISKAIKYSKIKPEEQKQREVKLNTARVMSALSFTGIAAGSLYLSSVVTPGLSATLPFLESILPILPGILPGIGFAISACYLIRKAYVYHQSKKHGLSPEELKKSRNKMLLAVTGAVGQMILFASMMTMVALTGGVPVVAGAMLGAGIVILQKVVKWCVLKRAKACNSQAVASLTLHDIPLPERKSFSVEAPKLTSVVTPIPLLSVNNDALDLPGNAVPAASSVSSNASMTMAMAPAEKVLVDDPAEPAVPLSPREMNHSPRMFGNNRIREEKEEPVYNNYPSKGCRYPLSA